MEAPGFWDDPQKSQEKTKHLKAMKDDLLGASPADGVNYSVPVNGYWEGMFVNKQVLEEAGISYEHMPSGVDSQCVVVKEGYLPKEREHKIIAAIKAEIDRGTIGKVRYLENAFVTSDYALSNIRMRRETLGGKASKARHVDGTRKAGLRHPYRRLRHILYGNRSKASEQGRRRSRRVAHIS